MSDDCVAMAHDSDQTKCSKTTVKAYIKKFLTHNPSLFDDSEVTSFNNMIDEIGQIRIVKVNTETYLLSECSCPFKNLICKHVLLVKKSNKISYFILLGYNEAH